MKKRIEYFDVAKALLIALVVIGHELQYANPAYDIIPYTLAQEFIGSFYMPAFFVISGLLFDPKSLAERSWGEFGLRRIRTLVIPYFFFEMLAIVYKSLVLRSVSIVEGLRLMVTFRCNVGADWFLPAMFMADIIFFALVKYLHNKYVFAAAAVLCFAATPFLPAGHWWGLLFRCLLGLGFILIGCLLKKFMSAFTFPKAAVAFLLTAASSAACFKFGWGNDFYGCVLGSPPLFALSGIAVHILCCGSHHISTADCLR